RSSASISRWTISMRAAFCTLTGQVSCRSRNRRRGTRRGSRPRRARESLAVDDAAVDDGALEREVHARAEDVAPVRDAAFERPRVVELARDVELRRAAVLVLDVRELRVVRVALEEQAVEIDVLLQDREQRDVILTERDRPRREDAMARERLPEAVRVDHGELVA